MKDITRKGSYKQYWIGEHFRAIYIRMAFQYFKKDLFLPIVLAFAGHRQISLSLVDP